MCDGFPSASLSGPQVVSPQASAGQFSRHAICGGLNADLQDGGQGRLPEKTPGETALAPQTQSTECGEPSCARPTYGVHHRRGSTA